MKNKFWDYFQESSLFLNFFMLLIDILVIVLIFKGLDQQQNIWRQNEKNSVYFVYKFSMAFVFFAPLIFAAFQFFKKTSYKWFATHLLGSVLFATFCTLGEYLLELLPKRLLLVLMNFLETWKIIGLWYYLSIFLILILSFVFLRWYQKIQARHKKLKALEENRCLYCYVKNQPDHLFCFSCGNQRTNACAYCQKQRVIDTSFCPQCGKA